MHVARNLVPCSAFLTAMSTYDLDPVRVSRELLDRRRQLREEAQRLIAENREIRRDLEASRDRGLRGVGFANRGAGSQP